MVRIVREEHDFMGAPQNGSEPLHSGVYRPISVLHLAELHAHCSLLRCTTCPFSHAPSGACAVAVLCCAQYVRCANLRSECSKLFTPTTVSSRDLRLFLGDDILCIAKLYDRICAALHRQYRQEQGKHQGHVQCQTTRAGIARAPS